MKQIISPIHCVLSCLLFCGTLHLSGTTQPGICAFALDDSALIEAVASAAPDLVLIPDLPYKNLGSVTVELGGITLPATRGLLETIYNAIVTTNPYCKIAAQVRILNKPTTLSSQEASFLVKRDEATHKALEELLGRSLDPDENVRIAICSSGGGFRALLSTEGLLEGFAKEGILDTVTYITTLSGSTWAVAPWLLTDQTYNDFGPELKKRVTKSIFSKTLNEQLAEFDSSLTVTTDCFLRRFAFNEAPSIIDFYGLMLGLSLFSPEEKKLYLSTNLASQIPHIAEGQNPYPLYTSVIAHKKVATYTWLEFSPYEVCCPDQQWAVPSWAYGRKFEKGVSHNAAPALTLGYLMGVWGSAMTFSAKEACEHTLAKLQPQIIFKPLLELINSTPLSDLRFFPAIIANPGYSLTNTPIDTIKNHTVIDGGFEQDLPIVPLFNKERAVDLIIICDSSADVATGSPLKRVETYAKKHNIPLPPIPYEKAYKQPFSLFDCGPHSKAPMILYMPLIQNPRYSTTFNPQKHLGLAGFLNTTNFVYSEQQATLLSGLFRYTAQEASDTIKTLIEIILHRKKSGSKMAIEA